MIKTRLNGSVYDFCIDYNIIDTSNIIDIHMYLMKKWHSMKCLNLFKKFCYNDVFFSCNSSKCVSINNQECRIMPQAISVNSNQPLFTLTKLD